MEDGPIFLSASHPLKFKTNRTPPMKHGAIATPISHIILKRKARITKTGTRLKIAAPMVRLNAALLLRYAKPFD